jgi:ornithine decarboxylase
MVQPMYAVKCNPHPYMIDTLQKEGVGFDVASQEEIRITSGRRIFANPCKTREDILFAKASEVPYMTFDSPAELHKIMSIFPEARPILRIHVDDKGGSRIPLNTKFGLPYSQILSIAGIRYPIFGLAFHVGSDCTSAASYASALAMASIFHTFLKQFPLYRPAVLDIGGGFSGHPAKDSLFEDELAPVVRNHPILNSFESVIAEPGRFFAEHAGTAQVEIIGRKVLPNGKEALTIDESLYGLFSGIAFDGFKPVLEHTSTARKIPFVVFGRTCDSADKLGEFFLPESIDVGTYLTVRNIGAYSYTSASTFNGFPKAHVQLDD